MQNLAALWNCGVAFADLTDEQREGVTGHRPDAFVRVCTFHPGYGYEDFIEGFRPTATAGTLSFKVKDGIFKRLCRAASGRPEGPVLSACRRDQSWRHSPGSLGSC